MLKKFLGSLALVLALSVATPSAQAMTLVSDWNRYQGTYLDLRALVGEESTAIQLYNENEQYAYAGTWVARVRHQDGSVRIYWWTMDWVDPGDTVTLCTLSTQDRLESIQLARIYWKRARL